MENYHCNLYDFELVEFIGTACCTMTNFSIRDTPLASDRRNTSAKFWRKCLPMKITKDYYVVTFPRGDCDMRQADVFYFIFNEKISLSGMSPVKPFKRNVFT